MPDFLPLLIGLVVVLAGIAAYLGHLAAKRRREALQALANGLGWRFSARDDSYHDEEYDHFEIFRRGHSRRAYNTLRGELDIDGRPFAAKAGDYRYKVTRSTGKSTTTSTYRFSYLILHMPFARAPDLLIRPEGIFDKLAGAFGFDDIDFESEEFSRRFHVKSADKRFAYDVLHPRMMEFLLGRSAGAIDIEHGRCCLSDGTRRWPPEEFKARLQFLQEFFALWPRHVTADLEQGHA